MRQTDRQTKRQRELEPENSRIVALGSFGPNSQSLLYYKHNINTTMPQTNIRDRQTETETERERNRESVIKRGMN